MNFKRYYLQEEYISKVKLIKENDHPLVIWGIEIGNILGLDFQGLWDRSGMEKMFPNEILQFTDSKQTKATFTVDYIDGTSFDELLDRTKNKLDLKHREFKIKKEKN